MGTKYKPAVIGVKYIDASDHVLGRLASKVAKLALLGYEVHVVNAEKTVITGKKDFVLSYWKHKILERGDWYKGQFYLASLDKMVLYTNPLSLKFCASSKIKQNLFYQLLQFFLH